jgi:hypothetical protein
MNQVELFALVFPHLTTVWLAQETQSVWTKMLSEVERKQRKLEIEKEAQKNKPIVSWDIKNNPSFMLSEVERKQRKLEIEKEEPIMSWDIKNNPSFLG